MKSRKQTKESKTSSYLTHGFHNKISSRKCSRGHYRVLEKMWSPCREESQSYITAHHVYWYYKFLSYNELAEIMAGRMPPLSEVSCVDISCVWWSSLLCHNKLSCYGATTLQHSSTPFPLTSMISRIV